MRWQATLQNTSNAKWISRQMHKTPRRFKKMPQKTSKTKKTPHKKSLWKIKTQNRTELITVKFFGGAKKSFGTDLISVKLDYVTIRDLLKHLLSIKQQDAIDLDTKNILVAVNGVDTSALNDMDTITRAGDVVSIIPIIHGGNK